MKVSKGSDTSYKTAYGDALRRFRKSKKDSNAVLIPRWYKIDIHTNEFKEFLDQLVKNQHQNSGTAPPPVFIDSVEISFLSWRAQIRQERPELEYCQKDIILVFSEDWSLGHKFLQDSLDGTLLDLVWEGAPMAIYDSEPTLGIQKAFTNVTRNFFQPIGGIVDDGIGIFNERFNDKSNKNRFHALWMQDIPRKNPDGSISAGDHIDHYTIQDLSNQINLGIIDEITAYTKLNNQAESFHKVRKKNRNTHGTAVADLAFGCNCNTTVNTNNDLRNVKLFGVELPAETIADTTGTHQIAHLLQAVRWIVFQAVVYQQYRPNGPVLMTAIDFDNEIAYSPLVINVSMGSHAGDKFGNHFLSTQIDQCLRLYDLVTTPTDKINEVSEHFATIVYSFGNHNQDNLVAILDGHNPTVNWRIQPDDATVSFLEISHKLNSKSELATTSPFSITIRPPGAQKLFVSDIKINDSFDIKTNTGDLIGRVYGEETQGRAVAVVAIAPTVSWDSGITTAPPGCWEISIPEESKDLTLAIQVQRDDTPGSLNSFGRQSYLETIDQDALDTITGRYDSPIKPLSKHGNHSAWVNSEYGLSAGAVYLIPDRTGNTIPIPESSSGVGASTSEISNVKSPHVAAVTSLSPNCRGVMATGTYSGSVVRIDGTSAAAPQLVIPPLLFDHKSRTMQPWPAAA